MRLVRFEDSAGVARNGVLASDGTVTRIVGDPFGRWEATGEAADVARLLAPVVATNVFCIGQNYALHAAEAGSPPPERPIVFMKATTAITDPGAPIRIPSHLKSDEVDFEGELAVVIGRAGRDIARADALDHVLGYTCANDVSARDWQGRWGGSQWVRGKTFDTFAPLGPALVLRDEIPDPSALRLRTLVNGVVMQDAPTADMIFDVPTLIAFLSGDTTLLAGTVILTGTPHGIGASRTPPVFLQPGDRVSVEIEHIGTLTNTVVAG
jgi:2-keto-4-pentenoate hydratase/2-oxohepta-3-ene-1,7-dioic acid hydratase in catechol pathway